MKTVSVRSTTTIRLSGFQCRFLCAMVLPLAAMLSSTLVFLTVQEPEQNTISAKRFPSQQLPNSIQICEGLVSGGLPEGAAAFEELRKLGFKTIISVDGAKPDVELAAKYDLQYFHLPHGYDGISPQRSKELAKH